MILLTGQYAYISEKCNKCIYEQFLKYPLLKLFRNRTMRKAPRIKSMHIWKTKKNICSKKLHKVYYIRDTFYMKIESSIN